MTQPQTDEHVAYIRSTIDPDTRKAACLLRWGPVETLLTPEVTLNTARDLMAAAAHAEADIAFLAYCREQIKVDLRTAGLMLRDIRARRPAPSGKTALRIQAVAGARTGQALVHIGRGSMKGELAPDEAREMAGHWTEAAMAAQIDVRLRYVLADFSHVLTPGDIEQIFAKLQGLQR
ncbi:hypothetical protein ACFXPN_29665 [Streptomyces griseorubiginosus]|uniref:hypothetical protein n=1 Tax=Streptomyces griseorubiginosus TaxID=67304 RepID=UPI00369A635F